MNKSLKHVRIVTDNGDMLLIRREALPFLLRSLELLAGGRSQPALKRKKK